MLIGLGNQKQYTSDRARSVASNICRYANNINVFEFSVDGDSFGLQKNGYTQAFCEGLVLGSYEFKDYKTEDDENNKVESHDIENSKCYCTFSFKNDKKNKDKDWFQNLEEFKMVVSAF